MAKKKGEKKEEDKSYPLSANQLRYDNVKRDRKRMMNSKRTIWRKQNR